MKHYRKSTNRFDIIVVGGGHAGIEAAVAGARLGCQTLLVSQDLGSIGRLSCNPSIGGSAKGHLVKEIDALGGVMPYIADRSGLLFKMLNTSKGPAVWSPRSQNDKDLYPAFAQQVLLNTPNLSLCFDLVDEVLLEGSQIKGIVTTSGETVYAKCVILCTGTFLNGILHTGSTHVPGGRIGEKASGKVGDMLDSFGVERGRLKTGTPPRILASSINYSKTEPHPGDIKPYPFSIRSRSVRNRLLCYATNTGEHTHEILREGFADSPMYTGRIKGAGPRYCPSIEDKISRFSERSSHQIVLEPEGLDTDSVYVNGFSTSLPAEIQERALRTIPGLEKCVIDRYGYAVEYDFFFPYQVRHTLESKAISGLFMAGQINGTSGYEEAAAQGLVAGVNAAALIHGEERFVLQRSESYIGVMIDDLVNKNTEEPYRVFTSLAEYRLLLRQDNAYERLAPYKRYDGLGSTNIQHYTSANTNNIRSLREFSTTTSMSVDIALTTTISQEARTAQSVVSSEKRTLAELVKRPEVKLQRVLHLFQGVKRETSEPAEQQTSEHTTTGWFAKYPHIVQHVENDLKYEGYIKRMLSDVEKFKKAEQRRIPEDFDYGVLNSLSTEARQKLQRIRPETIGQAGRISGISATDLSILTLYLTK